jgi:L-ascorbate metabolism protein UlaG (beta-lactamase superfamily)
MQARTLGWAGVQLRDAAGGVVVDPLADPSAVWAPFGDPGFAVPVPQVVPAEPAGGALAGLVTHLHRDHADAAALASALEPGAPVLVPAPYGGSDREELALAQATRELDAAGLALHAMAPWERYDLGSWSITALPAADGSGDPQVSWLVSGADGVIFHGGDTLMHGWWWRIAERSPRPIDVAFLPINAARVAFPHRRPASPLPAIMGGREAAIAARLLRARRLVPIHYGAYAFPPFYEPDPDALATLEQAAAEQEVAVTVPPIGKWFDVAAPVAAA